MSLSSKALMTVATAFAGNELRRFIGGLEMEDLLHPVGLTRRRSHLGESLLFMSAGIVVGGAAAVIFATSKRTDVIAWLSKAAKESVDEIDAAVDEVAKPDAHKKEKVREHRESDSDNHQPGIADASS
jgi:hypothetical protein